MRLAVGAEPLDLETPASAGGWTPEKPPQLPPVDEAAVRAFVAQVSGGRA